MAMALCLVVAKSTISLIKISTPATPINYGGVDDLS